MADEYNPVSTATSTSGQKSILDLSSLDSLFDGSGGFGGGLPSGYDPVSGNTNSNPGSVFGTDLPTGYDPVTGNVSNSSSWDSLWQSISNLSNNSSTGGTPSAAAPTSSSGGLSDWLKNLISGNPANGGLSGLGPYAAVAALGMNQAKDAQSQAKQEADQMAALGKPYSDAAQQLLNQFQSGKLRPEQQNVVDLSNKFGDQLSEAASPLQQIAQQAFSDYNSGKLNAADELKLQNQVSAQKQQMRQMMASSGITDSSVLAAQDQQIDNQALIARQDLLDKRFATGNSAYDQWLKTTTEGQQLKIAGQQFASQSFEQMLNDALGLGKEGMEPAMQALQLKIQSDQELSQTVSELLGNLASAYAYAAAGPKTVVNSQGSGGGGGTSSGGGGSSGLGGILSNIGGITNAVGDIGKLLGFNSAGGQAAGGAVGGLQSGLNTLSNSGILSDSASNFLGASSNALGAAAAPLSAYNAVKNWKPGDTGGDTLRGAEAGASIGSIVPGVGTILGGAVGGLVGAASSLVGHKESAGHKALKSYLKDVPPGTPGSQIPTKYFEEALLGAWQDNQEALSTFTQMDNTGRFNQHDKGAKHGGDAEGFKSWLVDQLSDAVVSGKVKPGMSSEQVFKDVVGPAMDQFWKSTGSNMNINTWNQNYPWMTQFMTQLTDRALSGQQIDRHSESDYAQSAPGYKDVPSLQEAVLQKMGKKP